MGKSTTSLYTSGLLVATSTGSFDMGKDRHTETSHFSTLESIHWRQWRSFTFVEERNTKQFSQNWPVNIWVLMTFISLCGVLFT